MAQRAIIWGASGDIGKALSQQLKSKGWEVVAISRNTQGLTSAADYTFEADPTNGASVERTCMEIGMEGLDEADMFIYAAGDITAAPVAEMDIDTFRRILDANFTGAFQALYGSKPLLTNDASWVFIGAVSERLQLPGLSAYAASKAALEAFLGTVKKEERKRQVLLIRPGAVDTKLWDKVPMSAPKGALTPDSLATKIIDAIEDGKKGQLDITE